MATLAEAPTLGIQQEQQRSPMTLVLPGQTDILGFNVDSCTTITFCTLALKVIKA